MILDFFAYQVLNIISWIHVGGNECTDNLFKVSKYLDIRAIKDFFEAAGTMMITCIKIYMRHFMTYK
jgi:hypothetical protein